MGTAGTHFVEALANGLDLAEIGWMALRAVVLYVWLVTLLRIAKRSFMGRYAAFDVVLAIMIGSVVGRAINGSAPFVATLAASLVLCGMDWLFAWICLSSERALELVRGRSRTLVEDGRVLHDVMARSGLSGADLREALRLGAKLEDPGQVRRAALETGGRISVLPRERPPRVIEVSVEGGVQTVRIELGG